MYNKLKKRSDLSFLRKLRDLNGIIQFYSFRNFTLDNTSFLTIANFSKVIALKTTKRVAQIRLQKHGTVVTVLIFMPASPNAMRFFL